MKSIFTISLDFELHWGGFEKWPLDINNVQLQKDIYNQYFLNTRKVIPQMLALFEKYEIHVTWATVGMLMHENKEQLETNLPTVKPTYAEEKLSAYHYIKNMGIGNNEREDPFHYADSLIQQILNTPYQELGTHTFAHYYCNEPGQNIEQFRADLQAAQKASSRYGRKLQSLVFPRNQFNDSYLKVCSEEGIKIVRSNPLDWFWNIQSTQNESVIKRLNRGLDAYFSIGKSNTYFLQDLQKEVNRPLCLPASRLLRPYRRKELLLNNLKINRIKSEIERAARNAEVYHLWWHPHNFGNFSKENLNGLENILQHFTKCSSKYNMQSLSMGEIADLHIISNA
jgi:peptidoglycan/xylan/chitin deacetylase (PgdA/CDA1 family)